MVFTKLLYLALASSSIAHAALLIKAGSVRHKYSRCNGDRLHRFNFFHQAVVLDCPHHPPINSSHYTRSSAAILTAAGSSARSTKLVAMPKTDRFRTVILTPVKPVSQQARCRADTSKYRKDLSDAVDPVQHKFFRHTVRPQRESACPPILQIPFGLPVPAL